MTANTSDHFGSWPLAERARVYGCPDLIRLDEPLARPEQIDYLDLLPPKGPSKATTRAHAVAEHQGTALLYLLDTCDDSAALETAAIQLLQKQLANRSDPAWLGIVRPGSLELHPISFHPPETSRPVHTVQANASDAPLFFQNLVHGTLSGLSGPEGSDFVFKKIYELLVQTIDAFVDSDRVRSLEILSMAGRALFFRFLIDRKIIRSSELPDICPTVGLLKDCFSDVESAAHTSSWLDDTFNGDFLPLIDESVPQTDRKNRYRAYLQYFQDVEETLGTGLFDHLHAIINGWSSVGNGFQTELGWGDLDFAHIPVGVLSQVYESFSHRVDGHVAKKTSVHYTPRNIASLMVDQVFAATPAPTKAKVLDPACGAGIFLVLAFRRLVKERWREDRRRPDTRKIQHLLYHQLRGFDISESALRLAALSLYITAIEVNGTQRPPDSLKFPKNLRNSVLFNYGEGGSSFTLGSLGPNVPQEFDGSFDIVIGNPPWTRLREEQAQSVEGGTTSKHSKAGSDEVNRAFTSIGRRVLQSRGFPELARTYENPDKNPDLPFLWRAGEWAKQDEGLIAFALPARVFGRTSGKGYRAWCAVLRAFTVNGLINGADLRKTAVWESVDMPFGILFARNAIAQEDHQFFYSTPKYEPEQNRQSRFRIDYDATRPISVARVIEDPWVLKTLSLGTWRDVALMERIQSAFGETLASVWKAWNPKLDKTGQGYNRSPGLKQKPADFLGHLPDFERKPGSFSIHYPELRTYGEKYALPKADGSRRVSAYRPKTEELFKPPLVIIPQSPGDRAETPRAFISDRPVTFSQSYYGYSCNGHPQPEILAALIYLLPHSSLLSYFTLLTSRRTGFDRQTFNKEELDAITFPDPKELGRRLSQDCVNLAHRLQHESSKPWAEIDALIFRLYGLDQNDAQTIHDTLFAAAAYRRQGRAALQRTRREHRQPFLSELKKLIDPYFQICGEQARVEALKEQPDSWKHPWFFMAVSYGNEMPSMDPHLLSQVVQEANRRSASRIIARAPDRRGLVIGLLNQRRWWTRTRAQLCGQHILRHHLGAFGLEMGAAQG